MRAGVTHVHRLIRTLSGCHSLGEIFSAIEASFVETFGLPVAIVIGDRIAHHSRGFLLQPADLAVAAAASNQRRPQSSESAWFLPLTTWRGTFGTLAIPVSAPRRDWEAIECFASLTAVAILRTDLEDQARYADVLYDADRFQKALLDSISHNVRTPISAIITALTTLQPHDDVQRELIDTALQQSERLNRLLRNLLDLSRLEAGAVHVHAEPCEVQDLIGAALDQLGPAAASRQIDVVVQPDLPFVPMDFVLITQVLVNLLDNALKYSPTETSITVEARLRGNTVEIVVADRGPGIAEQDLLRIFEKFNRAQLTGETGGVGLGLSICKGLVEAHHGKIWAQRREPVGTEFRFTLPCPGGGR